MMQVIGAAHIHEMTVVSLGRGHFTNIKSTAAGDFQAKLQWNVEDRIPSFDMHSKFPQLTYNFRKSPNLEVSIYVCEAQGVNIPNVIVY